MTAGGFHPAYQPPANADLPTQRRLLLPLSQGGDISLTLSSYLAITSNTVQFGSKLELSVNIGSGFKLYGFLGFDALFRFNPFYVEVRIGAGVAIKRGSSSVLSISLNLLVSGPAPWHIDGEGSFKILFFKIKFRINRTFGGGATQPALPTTDVRSLLAAALADRSNWEVQLPALQPANTVVLRTEGDPSELVVDPGGALVVHQKVVPLGYPIEVYGNTRTINGNQFTITGVTMGSTAPFTLPERPTSPKCADAFAPGQFRRMSDGEKLSAPSFQSLLSGLRITSVDGLDGPRGRIAKPALRNEDFCARPGRRRSPGCGNHPDRGAARHDYLGGCARHHPEYLCHGPPPATGPRGGGESYAPFLRTAPPVAQGAGPGPVGRGQLRHCLGASPAAR